MEDPIMGRRKKKAAKVAQWEKANGGADVVEAKIVIEDPAENMLDEVEVETSTEEVVVADVEEVIAEVEDKVEAKTKKKRKKTKSED